MARFIPNALRGLVLNYIFLLRKYQMSELTCLTSPKCSLRHDFTQAQKSPRSLFLRQQILSFVHTHTFILSKVNLCGGRKSWTFLYALPLPGDVTPSVFIQLLGTRWGVSFKVEGKKLAGGRVLLRMARFNLSEVPCELGSKWWEGIRAEAWTEDFKWKGTASVGSWMQHRNG